MMGLEMERVRREVHLRGLSDHIGDARGSLGDLRDSVKTEGMQALGGLRYLLEELDKGIQRLECLERDGDLNRLRAAVESLREKALARGDNDFADELDRAMGIEIALDPPDLPDSTAQELWHNRGN